MTSKRGGHSSVYRGKKVIVYLLDGTTFVDYFIEKTGTALFFKEKGRVPRSKFRKLTIYKKTV